MRLAPVAITAAIVLSLLPLAQADEWFNVVTDYATDHKAGYQYGLRDVTLSPDENWVYGAWQHGDGIRWLYRYASNQVVLDTKTNPNFAGRFTINHVVNAQSPTVGDDNNTNWQSVVAVGNYVYGGTDLTNTTTGPSTGYYGGFQGLVVLPWTYGDNNTAALKTVDTSTYGGGIGGLAASGNYIYATLKSPTDGIVVRFDITNPTNPVLDTTHVWKFSQLSVPVTTDYFHGLVAVDDGLGGTDLYITSGDQTQNSRPAGALYRVHVDSGGTMTLLDTLAITNRPQDVALYNDTLYVTEWTGSASQIRKVGITATGLQDEGYIEGPPHPFNGGDGYRNANGGGYSGIDISRAGNIWLADQYWNDSGASGTPGELLTDRLYESAPIPEPGTIALFGLGVPVLIGALRRKRRV